MPSEKKIYCGKEAECADCGEVVLIRYARWDKKSREYLCDKCKDIRDEDKKANKWI